MEIPVINRMTDSLNNPSFISRLLSTFELGKLTHAHRFWKWGALFLALVYAFSSLVNKIKIIVYKSKSLLADASDPLISCFDDAVEDENDDVCSTSGSDSDDEDGLEGEGEIELFDDDFTVKGSFGSFSDNPWEKSNFKLRRRRRSFVDNFSLSDFVNGNGVVKLWDGLSLGVVEVDNAFSFLDSNYCGNDYNLISGEPVSTSSSVFLSAGSGLGVWDLRTGESNPAVHSEWKSDRKGKIVGVDPGRTGKVYVRDDVTKGLLVGDVRKVDSPLTEYDEDMWWDADGVTELDD